MPLSIPKREPPTVGGFDSSELSAPPQSLPALPRYPTHASFLIPRVDIEV